MSSEPRITKRDRQPGRDPRLLINIFRKAQMTTKPKRGGKRTGAGRPVTDAGTLPARQFGRVNDADWQALQEAFAGVGFVRWALPTLLAKALREKRKAER